MKVRTEENLTLRPSGDAVSKAATNTDRRWESQGTTAVDQISEVCKVNLPSVFRDGEGVGSPLTSSKLLLRTG
jgi:hypothetical protein